MCGVIEVVELGVCEIDGAIIFVEVDGVGEVESDSRDGLLFSYFGGEENLLGVVVVFVGGEGHTGACIVGVLTNDVGGWVVAEFGVEGDILRIAAAVGEAVVVNGVE